MYRLSEKNLLNSNTSSTCSDNSPVAAEICWRVWGTPVNFNGFRVLAALLHGTLVVGVSKLCGIEQRAPPIFGRAAITLGIGLHFWLFECCAYWTVFWIVDCFVLQNKFVCCVKGWSLQVISQSFLWFSVLLLWSLEYVSVPESEKQNDY